MRVVSFQKQNTGFQPLAIYGWLKLESERQFRRRCFNSARNRDLKFLRSFAKDDSSFHGVGEDLIHFKSHFLCTLVTFR